MIEYLNLFVPIMALDETDKAIISALNQDARLSQRQLAQIVGVAQGTITNRIRRLEEEGVITGYTLNLDPNSLVWLMNVMAVFCIDK